MEYDDIKINHLFSDISTQDKDFKNKTSESINRFVKFEKERVFSDATVKARENFNFSINTNHHTDIQKANKLIQCVSGGVKRHYQNISISEDTYNYTVGAYSSINVGNRYGYTNLTHQNKKSIHAGKTISMSIGNATSKNHITNNRSKIGDFTKCKNNPNSFSIKDLTGAVNKEIQTALYISSTILIRRFFKTSSSLAVNLEYNLLRVDMTMFPIKGHFTKSQQIISAGYGDFIKHENLARIFAFTFTQFNDNTTLQYENLTLMESQLCLNLAQDEITRREDARLSTSVQATMIGRSSNQAEIRTDRLRSVNRGTCISV